MARGKGFEPLAFGSGGEAGSFPLLPQPSPAGDTIQVLRSGESQPASSLPGSPRSFSAHTRPNAVPARATLQAVEGGRGHLLTVRAVAGRLGVSTATVYKLVAGGDLPHIRVSNAIRVTPDDLAAFIARRRGVTDRS